MAAKKTTKTTSKTKVEEVKLENEIKESEAKVEKVAKQKPIIRESRDMNELIRVVNITNTPLIYESKSQVGYRIEWDGYLEDNWIEYKELINMRNSQRTFFEDPWVICDWDVLEDLKVDRYYKNIIDLENLDKIFKKSPEELEKTLKEVPNGIKKLIMDRAFELRRDKKLDSLNIIETIEKTLKVDLSI